MSQNPYFTLPSSSSLSPSTSTGQDFHPSWTQAHLGSSYHMSKAWQAVLISKHHLASQAQVRHCPAFLGLRGCTGPGAQMAQLPWGLWVA